MAVVDAQDPAEGGAVLTKSDTVVYAPMFRAFYVGGAGAVAVRGKDGNSVTFSAVPVGTIVPIRFDQLLSTGTDATLVVGLK
jgi:hypothetical protein